MEDIVLILRLLLFLSLAIVLVLACIIPIIETINFLQCSSAESTMPDRDFRLDLFRGCLMQTPSGLWIKLDDIALVEQEGQ